MKYNGRCCLLIESDPRDQECFLEALHSVTSDTGCYAVSNGEEAIMTIQEEKFVPEYIFTEMNVAGSNGIDLLKKLRAFSELAHVPVVIYTSNPSDEIVVNAKSLGAVAIHVKTTVDTLKGILRSYFPSRARTR
jgi:CheY-like chemotaxis protein